MQKNTEAAATPKRLFKKATAEIVKLEPGDTVEGKYLSKSTGPWIDKATGEEKELTRLFFEKENGEKFILFEDGGLRNAMTNGMVSEGDTVRIEKLEKAALHGGRTVNQYDIYIAQ